MEHYVVGVQVLLGLEHGLVDVAQRRSPVAGDVAGGVEAGGAVQFLLQHGQAHQRLDACHQNLAGGGGVFFFQVCVAD